MLVPATQATGNAQPLQLFQHADVRRAARAATAQHQAHLRDAAGLAVRPRCGRWASWPARPPTAPDRHQTAPGRLLMGCILACCGPAEADRRHGAASSRPAQAGPIEPFAMVSWSAPPVLRPDPAGSVAAALLLGWLLLFSWPCGMRLDRRQPGNEGFDEPHLLLDSRAAVPDIWPAVTRAAPMPGPARCKRTVPATAESASHVPIGHALEPGPQRQTPCGCVLPWRCPAPCLCTACWRSTTRR